MKNGRNHQSTPAGAFEWANRRWGPFDIDAAAADWNAKCPLYFTEQDNSLAQVWNGKIWINPPWANIRPFVQKAIESVFVTRTADLVVMLLPVRGGRDWYIELVERYAQKTPIRGRLKFQPPPGEETGAGGFEDCAYYLFERPVEAAELMQASSL